MKKNWFYRKSSIKKLYIYSAVFLGIVIITEYFITMHPHFKIESIFSFYAIFGFLSCVVLIFIAKILGFFIKRKDDYYDMLFSSSWFVTYFFWIIGSFFFWI